MSNDLRKNIKATETIDTPLLKIGGVDKTSDINAVTGKEATANKDASGGYAGLTLFKINFKNVANTFISFFTNSNTAARTYTFPDRNGSIADDTDLTTTLNAAKAYADALVSGLWDDRGNYDASGNTYPASGGSGTAGAILKGDIWTVSVTGTLNGKTVEVGDTVRALVDAPAQTDANWAVAETNIGYVAENSANKNASGGYAGLSLFKIVIRNAANTVSNFFTNATTVARTWTFQDRDGIIADDTDITSAKARGNHTGTQTASTISDFNASALSAAPAETLTTGGALITSGADKATPVDADEFAIRNSVGGLLAKVTWANIKATLKTYFDSLTTTLSNKTLASPIITGLIDASDSGAGQIKFPATQNPSADANTLDDYEEGTFNIGLTFGGGNTGITYSKQSFRYLKIGRKVWIEGDLDLSSKGSSTGAVLLTGLPFTIENAYGGAISVANITAISYVGSLRGLLLLNSTTIALGQMSEAGVSTDLDDTNFANNSRIIFSANYNI
jgi:hypothetical protein